MKAYYILNKKYDLEVEKFHFFLILGLSNSWYFKIQL